MIVLLNDTKFQTKLVVSTSLTYPNIQPQEVFPTKSKHKIQEKEYLRTMTDRMTIEQRHRCMSRIKGKDTKPEMLVRRYLHSRGYRYRVNVRKLPGTPDIVLRKYKTAIFINGCFWHGHEGCKFFVMPKSNSQFWQRKIDRNKKRDIEKRIQLRRLGWHTIVIWE